jgi:putative transposase
MPAELVIEALEIAVARRGDVRGVIHHSDQGSQYTSKAFNLRCKAHGVRVSMGSVGDCFDNAMAESLFATVECELLDLLPLFDTPEHADTELFQYIEGFYNTRRLHSALGHKSPVEFEAAHWSSTNRDNPQVVGLRTSAPRPSPDRSAHP